MTVYYVVMRKTHFILSFSWIDYSTTYWLEGEEMCENLKLYKFIDSQRVFERISQMSSLLLDI